MERNIFCVFCSFDECNCSRNFGLAFDIIYFVLSFRVHEIANGKNEHVSSIRSAYRALIKLDCNECKIMANIFGHFESEFKSNGMFCAVFL